MTLVSIPIKWVFRLCIYGAIIYAVYFIAATRSDDQIKKHALWFCNEIQIGDPPAPWINNVINEKVVLVQGVLDGAERESETFVVRFLNRFPFDDYECKVDAVNGKITAKMLD